MVCNTDFFGKWSKNGPLLWSVFWNLVCILRNYPTRFLQHVVNSRIYFSSSFIQILVLFHPFNVSFISFWPIPFPGFDRFYLGLPRILVCILENCGQYLVRNTDFFILTVVFNTDFGYIIVDASEVFYVWFFGITCYKRVLSLDNDKVFLCRIQATTLIDRYEEIYTLFKIIHWHLL